MLRIESHFLRKRHFYWCRIILAQFCFFLILSGSCIDRISIKIPDSYSSQLVVDGLITDEPGPYTINLSIASPIEDFLKFRKKVTAKSVMIFDNEGNSELLEEVEKGIYQTKVGGIRGIVGRSYSVCIEMSDGKIYESIPDRMNPVGGIDSLYYTLDPFQPIDAPTQYSFVVYVDAKGIPEGENFSRFRYEGVFQVEANPELYSEERIIDPGRGVECVLAVPGLDCVGLGLFDKPCTCCTCWVTQFEEKPMVISDRFIGKGAFRSIRVGSVPVEYWPFRVKYRMEVSQLSLSRIAYNYWNTVQSQKEAGSSLFQPPYGKAVTNIFEKNGSAIANGIFYASSVKKKQRYLSYNDINEFRLTPERFNCYVNKELIAASCLTVFKNSTNARPLDWK